MKFTNTPLRYGSFEHIIFGAPSEGVSLYTFFVTWCKWAGLVGNQILRRSLPAALSQGIVYALFREPDFPDSTDKRVLIHRSLP
mmetsp:Transcript_166/g.137  ORF Transcript_166/g.137 Transcript_166/m.137 type:complete len:84 (-) Transcript_166:992-1243(-)